jgi:hypothetical protein
VFLFFLAFIIVVYGALGIPAMILASRIDGAPKTDEEALVATLLWPIVLIAIAADKYTPRLRRLYKRFEKRRDWEQ